MADGRRIVKKQGIVQKEMLREVARQSNRQ